MQINHWCYIYYSVYLSHALSKSRFTRELALYSTMLLYLFRLSSPSTIQIPNINIYFQGREMCLILCSHILAINTCLSFAKASYYFFTSSVYKLLLTSGYLKPLRKIFLSWYLVISWVKNTYQMPQPLEQSSNFFP